MKEFIVPDDGLVIKTSQGRPIFELSIQEEGSIFRMYNAEGESKVALATLEDSGIIFIGDGNKNSLSVSVSENVSEIAIMHSGKSITLAINETGSEIRFVNENNAITNKIYTDEDGGQIGLGDHDGHLFISAGAEKRGGAFHVMNEKGNTVILLESKEGNGNISILDKNKKILAIIESKEDGNIRLLDKSGHIIWTTLQ